MCSLPMGYTLVVKGLRGRYFEIQTAPDLPASQSGEICQFGLASSLDAVLFLAAGAGMGP